MTHVAVALLVDDARQSRAMSGQTVVLLKHPLRLTWSTPRRALRLHGRAPVQEHQGQPHQHQRHRLARLTRQHPTTPTTSAPEATTPNCLRSEETPQHIWSTMASARHMRFCRPQLPICWAKCSLRRPIQSVGSPCGEAMRTHRRSRRMPRMRHRYYIVFCRSELGVLSRQLSLLTMQSYRQAPVVGC